MIIKYCFNYLQNITIYANIFVIRNKYGIFSDLAQIESIDQSCVCKFLENIQQIHCFNCGTSNYGKSRSVLNEISENSIQNQESNQLNIITF